MLEAGVVLSLEGSPLYWHVPEGRTVGSLPDSRRLWEVLWHRRRDISGFAHSHPGATVVRPSHVDLTSFAAIEAAIGRRLVWPIVGARSMVRVRWGGPGRLDYRWLLAPREPVWTGELRRLSETVRKEIAS